MKEIVLTIISAIMLFVPWTILLLRENSWALESPAAELIIASYAAFMIITGIFTMVSYTKGKAQNYIMKICLIVNSVYAIVGVAALGMMIIPRLL